MTPKHFCILLLALIAAVGVVGQSVDSTFENDNQFPLENPSSNKDEDIPEGSGDVPAPIELPATEPTSELPATDPTPEVPVTDTTPELPATDPTPDLPVTYPTPELLETNATPDDGQTTMSPETQEESEILVPVEEPTTTVENLTEGAEESAATESSATETTAVDDVLTTVPSEPQEGSETTTELSNDDQFSLDNPSTTNDGELSESTGEPAANESSALETTPGSLPDEDNVQTTVPPEPQAESETSTPEGEAMVEEPQIEDVLPPAPVDSTENSTCPSPCSCYYIGTDFATDCSGKDLTELPSPINPITTTLIIKNNKLTEIPKEVAALSNLKVLDAGNNQIMDLALGSVSDLPELVMLKLNYNRLIYYPQDLKNSLSLTKLEELDLAGNDMRTDLKPEILSNFASLRKLTLPTSNPDLLQDICKSSKIETICTESCEKNSHECQETNTKDDYANEPLPALTPYIQPNEKDDVDPTLNNPETEAPKETVKTEEENDNTTPSGRSLSNNEPAEPSLVQTQSNVVESHPEEAGAKVQAATTETKTGGISKSVIGMIVAGMVVVVAAIAIKKNWTSIRKKFSSSPQPAERGGAYANGTSPEEVPLQDKDKSPV